MCGADAKKMMRNGLNESSHATETIKVNYLFSSLTPET